MIGRNLQLALATFTLGFALPASPATCQAQLCGCNRAPVTTYRPLFAPVAPVAAQTVSYMPYTAYRTVYANMPVTAYQPIAACGPCGTPTTVMRPVTSYALQPQFVPYTTYRPVVTSVNACYAPAAPACGGCGVAAPVGVPVVPSQMATSTVAAPYYAPPAAAPCGGCAPGAPAGTMISPGMPGSTVPSLPNINAPPSLNTPPGQPLSPLPQSNSTFAPGANSTQMGPPSAGYSTPGGANYSTPSQYTGPATPATPLNNGSANANGSASGGSAGTSSSGTGNSSGASGPAQPVVPESRLRPRVIPDVAPPPTNFNPDSSNPATGPSGLGTPNGNDSLPNSGVEGQKTNLQQPRLLNPDDRMTARPLPTTAYRPISGGLVVQTGATEAAPLGDDGWRAATAR